MSERTQQSICGHITNPCPSSPQFLQGNGRRGRGHVMYRCPLRLQFVHVHIYHARGGKLAQRNKDTAH